MNRRLIYIAVVVAACLAGTVSELSGAAIADQRLPGRSGDGFSLKLMGTAVVENSSFKIAVMAYGMDGRQRAFHEGDSIDGLSIHRILADRVEFLTPQGQAIILKTRSRLSASEAHGEPGLDEPRAAAHGPRPPQSRRHDHRRLDRRTLASAPASIDDIQRDVRIETVMVYGKPAGLRIAPIEPGSIYSFLGLKAGEVIQQVGDAAVSLPEQALAIFEQLKEGHAVNLKVKGRRTRWIHLTAD